MLDEYIFVDEDNNIKEEMGLGDVEVAEEHAERLAKKYNCQITCYLRVVTVEAPENEVK